MTTMTAAADWRADGACADADPDLFFPISETGRALPQIARAKEICRGCPVRRPCLDFARANEPIQGIWGGTTPQERAAARRGAQRRGRPAGRGVRAAWPGRRRGSNPAALRRCR